MLTTYIYKLPTKIFIKIFLEIPNIIKLLQTFRINVSENSN